MKQLRKNARKALAALMSVWLSGVVFLFACSMPMAISAAEHCPRTKPASGHCNKTGNANTASQLVSNSGPQALSCCGFMPAVFDKTRKVEREVHASQPAAKPAIPQLRLGPVSPRSPGTTRFYSSFSVVQNKIFIKHGVLRI
ncbi:MAG: hypothetical protein ABI481_02960 [Pyrinomonadaceae bacterium]